MERTCMESQTQVTDIERQGGYIMYMDADGYQAKEPRAAQPGSVTFQQDSGNSAPAGVGPLDAPLLKTEKACAESGEEDGDSGYVRCTRTKFLLLGVLLLTCWLAADTLGFAGFFTLTEQRGAAAAIAAVKRAIAAKAAEEEEVQRGGLHSSAKAFISVSQRMASLLRD